ncbi:MAG: type II toxin-antitoxin system VapC family toxin [Phototrophicaceae bacterium]
MSYLLDSHTFVWAHLDPLKLSANVLEILEDEDNAIFLSYASIWELRGKVKAGHLVFRDGLMATVYREMDRNNLHLLPVLRLHRKQFATLPFYMDHVDPYDRILAAQSVAEQMPLLTNDDKFRQFDYGLITIW